MPSRDGVDGLQPGQPPEIERAAPGVRIRMYRRGLGDCFLLSFGDGHRLRHLLLDCGLFNGTPDEKAKVREIVSDVLAAAGSELAAVVGTHEHWDHVSGFFYAKDLFESAKPEEVWLAWTEDPLQTIAQEQKKQHLQMAAALRVAVRRLAASPSADDQEVGSAVAEVLGFGGPGADSEEQGPALGAAFAQKTDAGMDFLTGGFGKKTRFLKPGQVFDLDWVPGGLRVYVLGPPMDRAALRDGQIPREEGFKHPKTDGSSGAWMAAALGAANSANEEERDFWERFRPLDASRAIPEEDVLREIGRKDKAPDELKESKLNPADWVRKLALFQRYAAEKWRRIDADWLHSAGAFALQLDRSINNTSLVLAFELVASGNVLLFVGDAELENWASWQKMRFPVTGGDGKTKQITAADLLARTVFYKVGHHGSGNATLRKGLAGMTSTELVAAVPTDAVFASEKKGWEMPAGLLLPELIRKTRGRVILATPTMPAIEKPADGVIPDAAWKRFEDAVTGAEPRALFVDYQIDL